MALQLFSEENWDGIKPLIVENEEKRKDFFIISENAIQCDIPNQNNRIYPKRIVENDLNRYRSNFLNNYRAWGELGHPEVPKIVEINISHRFIELKENGSYYAVKAKILNTPNGKIVRALIEDGEGQMGISTRALGSTTNVNGRQVVQEDLYFVTLGDIVADPSAQSAFVKGVLEGKEWDWRDGQLIESINIIKEEYKENMSVEEKKKIILDGFNLIKKSLNEKELDWRLVTKEDAETLINFYNAINGINIKSRSGDFHGEFQNIIAKWQKDLANLNNIIFNINPQKFQKVKGKGFEYKLKYNEKY